MTEKILEKLICFIYLPRLRKTEKKIGYRLVLRNIPDRYINGWVACNMTTTWKRFGLDIEKGANYFTMGKVVSGLSSRFDREFPEYQSWLGGYTVRLSQGTSWTAEDHFKLAIADQNSWLRKWYGDPKPMTVIEGWKFTPIDTIRIGQYSGTLSEFGCTTHSDVGNGHKTIRMYLASIFMTALFNFSNPNLHLKASSFRPKASDNPYEILKLPGYIAIFDIEKNAKVVLYANGAIVTKKDSNTDTFLALKNDLRKAMQSCDIETSLVN